MNKIELQKRAAQLRKEAKKALEQTRDLYRLARHYDTIVENFDSLKAVSADQEKKKPWWKRGPKPEPILTGVEDRIIYPGTAAPDPGSKEGNATYKKAMTKLRDEADDKLNETSQRIEEVKKEATKEKTKAEQAEEVIVRILRILKTASAKEVVAKAGEEAFRPDIAPGTIQATLSKMKLDGKVDHAPREGKGGGYIYGLPGAFTQPAQEEEEQPEEIKGLALRKEIMDTIRAAKKPLNQDALFTRIGGAKPGEILETLGELMEAKKVCRKTNGYALTEWYEKSLHIAG